MPHHPNLLRAATGLLAVLGPTALVAGCGSPAASSNVARVVPTTPDFLTQPALERQVAGAFRAGLAQLAVMSQPAEDSADIGQDVPTGRLDDLACAPSGAQPSDAGATWTWSCQVAWRTVAGTPQHLTYAATLNGAQCFVARATPPLAPVRDTTIKSFAQHPLGQLLSLRRGC